MKILWSQIWRMWWTISQFKAAVVNCYHGTSWLVWGGICVGGAAPLQLTFWGTWQWYCPATGRRRSHGIAQLLWPSGRKFVSKIPLAPEKTDTMTFPSDWTTLALIWGCESECFHFFIYFFLLLLCFRHKVAYPCFVQICSEGWQDLLQIGASCLERCWIDAPLHKGCW